MSKAETEFLKIYDQFADAIFRHCCFKVSDREKAKDITQETFTRTWQYIVGGKDVENLKAFLYRIANNLIIDYYRLKKEVSLDKMQEEGFDVGFDDRGKTEDIMSGKEIIKFLDKLEPDYREVVLMRYIDDLSPKEIAEALNETANVISVRLNRGIKKLREILELENEK